MQLHRLLLLSLKESVRSPARTHARTREGRMSLASDSVNTTFVPLNSNGHTCLATIYDMFGKVTYRAERNGRVTSHLSVIGIPAGIVRWFESAYGGERIKGGWRVRGDESERLARELRYFAPRLQPQLDLYLEGRRLVGAKKHIRVNERWVTLSLSEKDKARRRKIERQLLDLEQLRQQLSSNAIPLPPIFLKRQSLKPRAS